MEDAQREHQAVRHLVEGLEERWTSDSADIAAYLAGQVSDTSHREVVGPLLAGSGASGVVRVGGREVASWGDPDGGSGA